ncbi:MAG: hypothetical protein WC356_07125 [Candidatus Micrarchaeia archaeon]|jgi:hypothetical protein
MDKTLKWIIGIVIILILAVIVILTMSMGALIFGRYAQGTPMCIFEEAGFVCNEVIPVIDTNGYLYGIFQHAKDETIIIKKVAFVEGADKNTEVKCWIDTQNIEVPSRKPISFTKFAASGIQGCKVNGEKIHLNPGAQIKGKLFIEYNLKSDENNEINTPKYAIANIIANVEVE